MLLGFFCYFCFRDKKHNVTYFFFQKSECSQSNIGDEVAAVQPAASLRAAGRDSHLCPCSSMAVPLRPPMSHMMMEWSELPENRTLCDGSQHSAVTLPEHKHRGSEVTAGPAHEAALASPARWRRPRWQTQLSPSGGHDTALGIFHHDA